MFDTWYFQVEGTLCGFDPFMNLVLDDSIEFTKQVCSFNLMQSSGDLERQSVEIIQVHEIIR